MPAKKGTPLLKTPFFGVFRRGAGGEASHPMYPCVKYGAVPKPEKAPLSWVQEKSAIKIIAWG